MELGGGGRGDEGGGWSRCAGGQSISFVDQTHLHCLSYLLVSVGGVTEGVRERVFEDVESLVCFEERGRVLGESLECSERVGEFFINIVSV